MTCQTCRSSCGDCPEGGITFKRVQRSPVPDRPPQIPVMTEQQQTLLFSELPTQVQQGLGAQKP